MRTGSKPCTRIRWAGTQNATALNSIVSSETPKVSEAKKRVRDSVEEFHLQDGRKLYLLGEGRLVNLAAAEGHPAAVMDMSIANQALGAEWIALNHTKLEKTVYEIPHDVDQEIARLKLHAMGVAIDYLTEEQQRYLTSWQEGT